MRKTIASSMAALLGAAALVSTAQAATIGDVFYIGMENHNETQPASYTATGAIYGDTAAPSAGDSRRLTAAAVQWRKVGGRAAVRGPWSSGLRPDQVGQVSGLSARTSPMK